MQIAEVPLSAVPHEPGAGESKYRSDEIREVDAVAFRHREHNWIKSRTNIQPH
jgi:hypothetical protein